jgi:galactokinase
MHRYAHLIRETDHIYFKVVPGAMARNSVCCTAPLRDAKVTYYTINRKREKCAIIRNSMK